ncbi:hypothetical protein Dtox_2407 [Desulfofarcimen acetoxidans DSM 771]|uniref:Uncharacterized protein n=1 Tax=Desulfofarcimen acetoxidans (strain ATCC 49208 / DSM 771 / KCTC 5769 / VKM B-1644 / 5575) TaxID=485916 RepID=C8W0G3_DESAS|nr:hypothetical protein [Desulfofarcimen acetoxidans]ACV63218.1 hypothetical protein Dtox_2407 [Desulfofarcimen acetoxidans DSM 771]
MIPAAYEICAGLDVHRKTISAKQASVLLFDVISKKPKAHPASGFIHLPPQFSPVQRSQESH